MYYKFLTVLFVFLTFSSQAALVINEVDYDQIGADTAEYLELYNNGPNQIDLTGYTVEFLDGNLGPTYNTINLPSQFLAAGDYFVICANAATVVNCDLDDNPNTNFIQNGAPDAIGLKDNNGMLIDAISYEGNNANTAVFTETAGTTASDSNTVGSIGLSRMVNGVDNNNNDADFTLIAITPGATNSPGTNVAPFAQDDADATDEDTSLNGDVLADNGNGIDLDPDGDFLSITEVNTVAASVNTQITLSSGALLTLSGNGTFIYNPNGAFNSLAVGAMTTDSFDYTVADDGNLFNSATVTITLTGVDDPPVAVNDMASVNQDAAATINLVLANDTDIDGGPKIIVSVVQPANGTVVIAGDSLSLTYAPTAGYCNDGVPTDDFTYTINGGSSATVAMTVVCAAALIPVIIPTLNQYMIMLLMLLVGLVAVRRVKV